MILFTVLLPNYLIPFDLFKVLVYHFPFLRTLYIYERLQWHNQRSRSSMVDKIQEEDPRRHKRASCATYVVQGYRPHQNNSLCNSAFGALHRFDCKNVTISGVTILSPVSGAPNTDGIDPDNCSQCRNIHWQRDVWWSLRYYTGRQLFFVWETRRVRIKTAPGRGGYVRNINMTLENVCIGIVVKTDCNEHPDKGFDPKGC